MIYFLKGILHSTTLSSAIIDVAGVGYEVFCTLSDVAALNGKTGSEVFLYTHLVHKEDSMTLYGFESKKTKNGFLELIKVSGIGAKAALNILSYYKTGDLFSLIQNEDVQGLTKIPGIGAKTAKKIIFDLKGTIVADAEENSYEADLISALTNMGYKETLVREAVSGLELSNDFEKDFKVLLKKLAG